MEDYINIINCDIDLTRDVLNGKYSDNYFKIYFNLNEDINILFNNLLNKDGFVICSNVCKNGNNGIGSLIFEKYFDCNRLPYVKKKDDNNYFSPGYCYTKKVK